MIGELTNHLWQSTLFAVAVWLLVIAFRKNRAQVRYWLWFSASLKFLFPFSLLMGIGSRLGWAPAARKIATQSVSFTMAQITQPFPQSSPFVQSAAPTIDWLLLVIFAVWVCGFGLIALTRLKTWRRIRAAVRASTRLEIPAAVEVRSFPGLLEPGVAGLFKPVLLLPKGIIERLTPAQLEAVLAHELCHVRRRDNLTGAIHMIVEAVFWFHPLVWWIGVELVKERERACDEHVLLLGSEPQIYAEGILTVCKFYVESPLACVAGITGHNLRKRVGLIMRNHVGDPLNTWRKLFLGTVGVVAVALPVVIGLLNATPSRAAEKLVASMPVYDAVSINPHESGNRNQGMKGGLDYFNATDVTLQQLIKSAYGVQDEQISGAPNWFNIERYDIEAKATRLDKSVTDSVTDEVGKLSGDLLAQRVHELVARANQANLQSILADRFKLTVHHETKEVPVYELVIAENGPKLKESIPRDSDPHLRVIQDGKGQITGREVPVATLARLLSEELGRTVLDKTGLKDHYDITLEWPTTGYSEQGTAIPPRLNLMRLLSSPRFRNSLDWNWNLATCPWSFSSLTMSRGLRCQKSLSYKLKTQPPVRPFSRSIRSNQTNLGGIWSRRM